MGQVSSPWGLLPDGWKLSTIKKEMIVVTDYVANGSFASLAENVQYSNTEEYAILIRLYDYNNNFSGSFVYVNEHAYNFLSKSKLYGDEIIISNVGANVGTVFKCPRLSKPMTLGPNSIVVKLNGNNDFYFYWFKSRYGKYCLDSIVSGSAQPKFNKTHFKELPIPVPPLVEQEKIASLLSSIDDKIAVNSRICANLEAQAQALFKSWFVDFTPFKDKPFVDSELGPIPQGWKVEKINDLDLYITDFVSNGSFASLKQNVTLYSDENYAFFIRNTDLKEGRFRAYVDKSSYFFLKKSVLHGGEIIISNVGDVGSVNLCPKLNKPMTLGNNIIMLKSEDEATHNFLYILFKWSYGKSLIKSITGGSAQPKFNKGDFKSLKIIMPTGKKLSDFNLIASSLLKKIEEFKEENQRLAALRDTLLPKLMSGEIKL